VRNQREKLVSEGMDKQYNNSDEREGIDYWAPLARLISELVQTRGTEGISQSELGSRMRTTQSVISRFENMGRLPNYDFVARLSQALGHAPGMTLFGEYMAVVPPAMQAFVKQKAEENKTSVQRYTQRLLTEAIDNIMSSEAQLRDRSPGRMSKNCRSTSGSVKT